MKSDSKNIALIGVGYWGKNLVRVFNQLGVLKIICDLDKRVLKERKKEYPNLKITTNFSEILKDKDIQAVVIATPAVTHYKLTKKALEKGKDVFVEKPLALKIKQGEELVKLAEKEKKIIMVGHILLYHPAIIKLKKLVKKGELGKIRYICSNRLNFGRLRSEENVLWSFASHDISVIIDILGMPKKVRTVGKCYLQKNIQDISLVGLEFKKNQAAHILVSWLNPFKEQKLSVIGEKKMAVFDGVKNELKIYNYKVKNLQAVKDKGRLIRFASKEPLVKEARYFLECIKKRKTQKGSLNVLKVLDACQKSIEKEGQVLNL